jgi:serine/threonine protein kinase
MVATQPFSPEVSDILSCAGGSLAYASPEQIKSPKAITCPSADIWSLGIILYALVTGKLPFADDYELRLQQKVLSGEFEMPDVSEELQDLINHCLALNPEKRLSIGQILNSSWCKN